MTAPTPVNPELRDRPDPAGGKAHWDALTTEAVATGGFSWQELRDGYERPNVREAELLPRDINRTDVDVEQTAPTDPAGG